MGEFKQVAGISLDQVIAFQVKVMMGAQYSRVMNAKEEKDVIVACLRIAWNDAFRHVSENQKGINYKKREEKCIKILESDAVYRAFIEYADKETTDEKAEHIEQLITQEGSAFLKEFETLKIIDPEVSDKSLCFGHFQKLFNMALKLYLCLYACQKNGLLPDPKAELGKEITEEMLQNADCPIDSIILRKLGFPFDKLTWSKIGKTDTNRDYIDAQNAIRERCNNSNKLSFDFDNWN